MRRNQRGLLSPLEGAVIFAAITFWFWAPPLFSWLTTRIGGA